MVRTLQALTVLAMISAGVVFVLCVVQWLQGATGTEEIKRNLGQMRVQSTYFYTRKSSSASSL